MNGEEGNPVQPAKTGGRSLAFSLLCMVSFTFFITLAALALTAACFAGTISAAIRQYLPGHDFTQQQITVLFAALCAAHLAGVGATWLLWRRRRTGFYILGVVCLLMATVQLFIPGITVVFTSVYIALVFLAGLFFRRLT